MYNFFFSPHLNLFPTDDYRIIFANLALHNGEIVSPNKIKLKFTIVWRLLYIYLYKSIATIHHDIFNVFFLYN